MIWSAGDVVARKGSGPFLEDVNIQYEVYQTQVYFEALNAKAHFLSLKYTQAVYQTQLCMVCL